ncbi:MAG: acyl-CoA dehydrogenase family protein [Candidatus Eisenbacteria bacterium]|nr:acyl-CoA dehydrogenase family protein [Candidatus Eisenbacteria bacterium]
MDLSFTPEQLALRGEVVKFARKELNAGLVERDHQQAFSREGWDKCAAMGIHGLPFPREHGGSGADVLTTMLAMEGLGYGCRDSGLIFAINAQMWAVQMPILNFGTEEQKRRYLPRLCGGEWIGAHGMTEPGSGSDSSALATTAVRRGHRWILNGTKTFVTNAPIADVFVVFATTDRARGFMGVTGFVVEKGAPGFHVGKPIEKMGLKTSPMAELVFEDCELPLDALLGEEGGGTRVFSSSMEWERGCLLASSLGAMERQLETCVDYATNRRQFNRPIGKFQSVANKIVDMKVRLETSRLLLYKLAWLKSAGGEAVIDAAIAKLHLSESWVQSCLDAIQIHGGYGYTTEFELERDLRDAIAGRIYSGTSEIQRNIIAAQLGL